MKRCFKCGDKKVLSAFYKHRSMRDGRLNKCIDCAKKDSLDYRAKNLSRAREYDRERGMSPSRVSTRRRYLQTERGKEAVKRCQFRHKGKYPDKKFAREQLTYALKTGRLKRSPCEVCGTKRHVHGHHDDYSKPLHIRWLCLKHHFERHKEIDPNWRRRT